MAATEVAMAFLPRPERELCLLPRACRRGVPPLILVLLLCLWNSASAAEQSKLPLVVTTGTHSLTAPWHLGPTTNRVNPALIIGTEHMLKPEGRVRLYLTANLGFFQHYWWMTGLFADSELGTSCGLAYGFHADFKLGLGYMHYFWRRKLLELSNGRYARATDWGRPSLTVPLSAVLGYRGDAARPLAVQPFISARWAVQALFLDEVPVMPHLFLLVGVRIDMERVMSTFGR
jgi:hypothetical protein